MIDALNVRFLLTEPGAHLAGKWKQIYGGRDGELFQNSAVRPRFYGPAGVSVYTREDKPGRYSLRIRSAAPARLEANQPPIAGWRVRLNGCRPALPRVNGCRLRRHVGGVPP